MKKALISIQEQLHTGYRVADVHPAGFEVAEPLFWVDCADDVVADQFYYDSTDKTIKAVPIPELVIKPPIGGAPNVIA